MMSSPFSIRKSTTISLIIIVMLGIGALGLIEVSPEKTTLIYPWDSELVLNSEWALVLSYIKGGFLGIFLLSLFRKIGDKMSANKENSPQKLAWKLEDALTEIYSLKDENRQLKAFNTTLKQAVSIQQKQAIKDDEPNQ